jgi:2-polyprenyl-3-methyl-5-hydroxy-6-metoxy-1,4-benzoquinol methylase
VYGNAGHNVRYRGEQRTGVAVRGIAGATPVPVNCSSLADDVAADAAGAITMNDPASIAKVIDGLDEAQWHELYLQHARGERSDLLPFPSEDIQVITNNQKGETTARGALSILDCVLSCVAEVREPTRDLRVLDYGCGWGRITRLLPFYFDVDGIVGVDVDDRLISSANELIPWIQHRLITSMQPLPFDDGSFEVIFANSVFSHLSEKACRYTLGELARLLSPGGVLVVSVLELEEMNRFYANAAQKAWIEGILGAREHATAVLQRDGFVWGDTGRWHEYGIAVMQDSWISAAFEQVGIRYGGSQRGEHHGSHNYKYGTRC